MGTLLKLNQRNGKMKKKIADIEPGVDVFWALVYEGTKSVRRKIVLTEKISDPDYLDSFRGKVLNDESNTEYRFDPTEEYEVIGHIGPDGKLIPAEE
jgi:hypothetical protein